MSLWCSENRETQETSDAVLMERLATRSDTAAFDTLFLRHQRAVFHFALRLLHGNTEAEDVTQETFLRLWRVRGTYRSQDNASLRTYLLTITRRLILDIVKRPHAEPEPLPEPKNIPERALLDREFQELVEQSLHTLPLPLREVIVLRDMESLNYEEIARITACPVGTVKSRLHTARARLRAAVRLYLKEDC